MGAGPSLGKFLKSMDDHDLAELVQSAYTLDSDRMEKIFALAKSRYNEENLRSSLLTLFFVACFQPGQQQLQADNVDAAVPSAVPAASLSPPQPELPSPAATILSEMVVPDSLIVTSPMKTSSPTCGVIDAVTAIPSTDTVPEANDNTLELGGVKDPMNALWTFEGHPLRELQAANKNLQRIRYRGLLPTDRPGTNGGETDPSTGVIGQTPCEVDAKDYPVMYGSCGRGKRYGRCSVCYFRGLRCNTAHYCACCQRSVCIRPRKYPGEEHHKICWNVLHMDKDMIQRVAKKKKRKLQALTGVETTAMPMAVSRVKAIVEADREKTESDTENSHRQKGSVDESGDSPGRGPSIPTVVADVSGAVNL
uniref:Uncharacterized protein n=1 Tax=Hyaloperonospora arabidopsidis (strain Emoy2) TaxID=559515 RepID=M4BN91_HYAAE